MSEFNYLQRPPDNRKEFERRYDKWTKKDKECDTCNGQHNNIVPCPKCGMIKDKIDE